MLRSPVFHAIAGVAILLGILAFILWPIVMVDEPPLPPPPAPATP